MHFVSGRTIIKLEKDRYNYSNEHCNYLIFNEFFDEITDSHKSLLPTAICITTSNFHWYRAMSSNFIEVRETKKSKDKYF